LLGSIFGRLRKQNPAIADQKNPDNSNDSNGGGTIASGGGATSPGGVSPISPGHSGGVVTPTHSGGGGGAAPASGGSHGSGGSYTVKPGDNLYDIAMANGMSLSQIEALNPQIKDFDLIYPGQKINMGGAGPSGGSGGYTVKPGDNLYDIAAAHGMSLSQIEALNPQIKDFDLIYPGQNINLGGGAPAHSVASAHSGGVSAPAPAVPTTHSGGVAPPPSHGGHDNNGGDSTTTNGSILNIPHNKPHDPKSDDDKHHHHTSPAGGSTPGTDTGDDYTHVGIGGGVFDPARKPRLDPDRHPKGGGGFTPPAHPNDPAIHGPHNQIAAGGTGGTLFPKTSSYPPSVSSNQPVPRPRLRGGWGGASTGSDPANMNNYLGGERSTDPLKIKDSKPKH
jgi:LysM repeat protein